MGPLVGRSGDKERAQNRLPTMDRAVFRDPGRHPVKERCTPAFSRSAAVRKFESDE